MHIDIDINDNFWPELTIIVNDGAGNVRTVRAMYDIAADKFEPLARDPLRRAIDSMIRKRKRDNNPT